MPKEYIDRESLLDTFARNWETITDIDDYYFFVKEAPTADVAPVVHGEWLITKKRAPNGRKILYEIKTCSVCGKTHGRHKPNYCPNCGAKMNGERRGNTEKRF